MTDYSSQVQDPHYLSHIQRTHTVIDLTNCLLVTVTLLHPTARYKVVCSAILDHLYSHRLLYILYNHCSIHVILSIGCTRSIEPKQRRRRRRSTTSDVCS